MRVRARELERNEFQVGDHVWLSEIGRKKSKKPERRGHIVSRSKTGSQCRVLWSGLKVAQLVHWSHLERFRDTPKNGEAQTLAEGPRAV